MSRYRNVHCLIWNDDKFPFASDDCKLVWFHLFTTPFTTPIGIFKAPVEGLAAEIGWGLERYRKAFGEGLTKAFWKVDERFHVILFPKYFSHNKPENPNVLRSWVKIYDELPNCELKNESIQSLKAFAKGWGEPFAKVTLSLAEGPKVTFAKQYQYQYQYQEKEKESPAPQKPAPSPSPKILCDDWLSEELDEPDEIPIQTPPAKKSKAHFEIKYDSNIGKSIVDLCTQLNAIPANGPKQLNPFEWVQQKSNRNGHPQAIIDTLRGGIPYLHQKSDWWGYLEKIFLTKNGNYNERDTRERSDQAKRELAELVKQDTFKKLLSGIGG